MIHLLAPVPACHLESAIEVAARKGKVAFGSQLLDFFTTVDAEYGEGLPVLIYASSSGAKSDLFQPGEPRATWRASLVAIETGDRLGRYPGGDEFRPPTALGDSETAVFWVVNNIQKLVPAVPIKHLVSVASGKPLAASPPKRPVLVRRVVGA